MVTSSKPNIHTGELVEYDPKYAPLGIVDIDDASDVFVDRILNSPTWEQAMQIPESVGLRDLVDHHVIVKNASGRRSQLDGTAGVYAVIDLTDEDTGADMQVTCGAKNVLALIVRAKVENRFPFSAIVREVVSNSDAKRRVLYLTAPPEPF